MKIDTRADLIAVLESGLTPRKEIRAILRAVNSHDELMELVKSLVDRLEDGSALKERARSAIAKAEMRGDIQ